MVQFDWCNTNERGKFSESAHFLNLLLINADMKGESRTNHVIKNGYDVEEKVSIYVV